MSKRHKSSVTGKQYIMGHDLGWAGGGYYNKCRHDPTEFIKGRVWLGSQNNVWPHWLEYDAVLNCTGTSLTNPTVYAQPHFAALMTAAEPEEYAERRKRQIVVRWPDGDVPPVKTEFWEALLDYTKDHKLLVHCVGGHGRTGTAAAILWALDVGSDGDTAIEYVRDKYCFSAIETLAQEDYIHSVMFTLRGIPIPKRKPVRRSSKKAYSIYPKEVNGLAACAVCGAKISYWNNTWQCVCHAGIKSGEPWPLTWGKVGDKPTLVPSISPSLFYVEVEKEPPQTP